MTVRTHTYSLFPVLFLPLLTLAQAPRDQVTVAGDRPGLVQASLVAPGSTPFHLKATIADRDDADNAAQIEIFWAAPDQ